MTTTNKNVYALIYIQKDNIPYKVCASYNDTISVFKEAILKEYSSYCYKIELCVYENCTQIF